MSSSQNNSTGRFNTRESQSCAARQERREHNNHAARRYRKNRRETEAKMEAAYNENEMRIAKLERAAQELSKQLQQH